MAGLTRDRITHCRNHHPFDEANTAWEHGLGERRRDGGQWRRCRTCQREGARKRRRLRRLERERRERAAAAAEFQRLRALGIGIEVAAVLAHGPTGDDRRASRGQ
jgi:hypothetical protein